MPSFSQKKKVYFQAFCLAGLLANGVDFNFLTSKLASGGERVK